MGELETEAEKTRSEIASYLHELADQIDGDGDVTLELGGQQVRLNPTEPVTFKLEGESDWSEGNTEAKQSIEFELVWWREAQTPEEGTLDITTEGE
jgi:amphi-Trp domain-containing protein